MSSISNMSKRLKLMCGLFIERELGSSLTENILKSRASQSLLEVQILNFQCPFSAYFATSFEDDVHTRMPGFHKEWIDKYLEYDFYRHFRMNRGTFNKIAHLLGQHFVIPMYHGGSYKPLKLEKTLQIALWYLNKGATLETVAERFNVASKTAYYSVSKILNILNVLSSSIIRWPTERQCQEIEVLFKGIAGFPGIIGAMDGCHFRAKVPAKQHDSYQDRHFQHSITMQAVCLPNLTYTNISAGYPGSLHDARILKQSNLYKAIEAEGQYRYFYEKYHLVADSAYPRKKWIMTPYRLTGNINRVQKKFNTVLSKSRVVIEHSFGVLKGRWKILQNINVYSVCKATKIIVSSCVLHNLCINFGDTYDEDIEELHIMEPHINNIMDVEEDGFYKRDLLAADLSL